MFCFKQKTQPYFSLQKQKRKPKKIQPLNDACWLSVFVCLGSSGLPGRAGSLLRGLSSTLSFLFNGGFWSGGLGLGWPQCDQTVSLEGLRDLDRRLAAWLSLGWKDTPEFAAQRRVSRQEMLSSALQKSLSPPAIPDRPCPWLQGPRSGCEKDLVFLREGLELLHGSMLRRRGWGMAGVSQHKLWGHLSDDWDLHFCWLQFDTRVTGRPSRADMGTLKPQHNAEGALPRWAVILAQCPAGRRTTASEQGDRLPGAGRTNLNQTLRADEGAGLGRLPIRSCLQREPQTPLSSLTPGPQDVGNIMFKPEAQASSSPFSSYPGLARRGQVRAAESQTPSAVRFSPTWEHQ